MSKIENKRAIVTGSTKGIGLAIVRALLERDAKVFICARRKDEVEAAVTSLRSEFGDRIYGTRCDVGKAENVREMIEEAESKLGGLDILVNNAGIGIFRNVEEMSIEEWQSVIETNLSGLFYCCHHSIPLMKRSGGGYIINIGSLAGKNPFAGAAAYSASKFGLIGFSESLMQEVRHDHIRVSYVMPGSVNTYFSRDGMQDPATSWKLASEDVAEVVINLLEIDPRALPSRVELRPSEPKK
jgi:NAD(P)-dependent dehydrogenase (short-subunit alcohol dehydrogenase family)